MLYIGQNTHPLRVLSKGNFDVGTFPSRIHFGSSQGSGSRPRSNEVLPFTHPVSSVSSSPWVLLRSMALMKEWLWDDLRKQRHDVAQSLLWPVRLHIETSRQQRNERPLFLSLSCLASIWPIRSCHPSLLSCWHTKTSIPFVASMIHSG